MSATYDHCPLHAQCLSALNRRAEVEDEMLKAARGVMPMPDAAQLRAWANRLGAPDGKALMRPKVSAEDLRGHMKDFRMGFLDEHELGRALGIEVTP